MDYQVDFTKAYKDLYEGIAAKGGVMGKGKDDEEKKPAAKPDAKAKGGDKKDGEGDESAVRQAVYDIRYRAKREGVPVAQAMTDYLKHSASLGPKARAELKKKLLGEEVEIDEAITSEKGKAKAAEMIAKRTTASGRAKPGQGDNVATIRHISRSNRDGLLGTPPNPKVAGSNWPKSYTGSGGKGNKAARRAGTYKEYDVNEEHQLDEISADLALTASQKADEVRRKAAISGDRETAAKKAKQASRLYKAVSSRRAKERMAKEEVEAEGYEPMTPERKLRVDRAKRGAYDKDQRAQYQGDKKEADKQFKRRMAMDSRTKMKKEEVENVEEVYKGKHGQSDKEYADSRSQGGKMVSGDSKQSGAEYTHGRRVKAANPGMQPDVGGKTKPKSQGKMDKWGKADLAYRKANLKAKKEEYTLGELKAILEDDSLAHLHADVFDLVESVLIGEEVIEEASSKKSQKGETLYKVRVVNNDDRTEVRYASRAKISQLRANDNIKSVEITGHGDAYNEKPKKGGEKKLDPVGKEDGDVDNDGDKDSSDKYLMKRRKAIGKAMAKEEYVDENRAAARSAGGYKDDSKKQPDPSKKGFTGIGNMSIDQIRKMSARIEKEKSAKK